MTWLLVLTMLVGAGAGLGTVLGQTNGLLSSSPSSLRVVQDTASAISWSSGWKTISTRSASGGTVHESGQAGASSTLAFVGTYVKVIGPTGRGDGVVQVTLDGSTTSVNTHGKVFRAQQVIFAAATSAGRHSLTLRVSGTTLHPYVSIDALVISAPIAESNGLRYDRGRGGPPRQAKISPTATPSPSSTAQPTPTADPSAPDPTATPTSAPATPDPTATPTPAPATPDPTATPTPVQPGQTVVVFPLNGSQSQFVADVQNMSIDVIEMAGGTYSGWHDVALGVDRTARPLLVEPVPGSTVTFNGNASSEDGLFYAGFTSLASHITFQGPFQITNFSIGQTGLVSTAWASDLTFNGFTVRGTTAPSTNGLTAWAVYVSSDGTHRGSNLTFNDWNVDNTSSASGHEVNGMQLYHAPQAAGVTGLGWTVRGGYWGFVGRYDATNVDIEGWSISGTRGPSFDSEGPAGVVRNMSASGSGSPIIESPMVDGGGNVW